LAAEVTKRKAAAGAKLNMVEKTYIGKKVIIVDGVEKLWVSVFPNAEILKLAMFELEEVELNGDLIVKRLNELKEKFQNGN
jgi:hypothetical protein